MEPDACLLSRRWLLALCGAGLVASGPSRAAVVERSTASRLSSEGDAYRPPTNLKMVADLYNRMTVPVTVDGRGPFPFIVDTGANQSVIAAELARRLDLPIGPMVTLNGIAGTKTTPSTRADLKSGRHELAGQILSILPRAGLGGDGILGLDAIGGAAVVLNFAAGDLRIEERGADWRDPAAIAVKAHQRDGQLTLVDVSLGDLPLLAFIDSGAQNTIGNLALQAYALQRSPNAEWTSATIVSATGQTVDGRMAELQDLRVGDLRMARWPVAFAALHTFKLWNMSAAPALLIGVDILSQFNTVCLDFAREEVRFLMAQPA